MATQTPATGTGLAPYRLTVKQFHKIVDAGIFPDGVKVELLAGILVDRTTNAVHDFLVTHIAELLRPRRPAAWSLREEKAVQLGRRWRPDPDIAILKADDAAFAHRSPRPRDVALLIEVSDTSYAKDSGIKLRGYAQFRIPLYWIVHVDRRQVEVYRDPYGRGGKAGYRRVEFHPEDVEVPILIEGQDLGRIPVKEMLP